MSALDDLAMQVQATADGQAAAVKAIQSLAEHLAQALAANDPAKLAALAAQLKTSTDALAAATAAATTGG